MIWSRLPNRIYLQYLIGKNISIFYVKKKEGKKIFMNLQRVVGFFLLIACTNKQTNHLRTCGHFNSNKHISIYALYQFIIIRTYSSR